MSMTHITTVSDQLINDSMFASVKSPAKKKALAPIYMREDEAEDQGHTQSLMKV